MPDQEIRCCACARLLFKMQAGALSGALSIKCPRCRAFNHLRPDTSPHPQRQDRAGKDHSCGCSSPQTT
ncbi:Com family DNA-binding transcriptional regulator [Cypionkella sinensis]|uniref:Com family DNA-binding transcriptional regulator n=1 Tax=Cypionkella sinensis TaxID=1756043 RepID=A0ABV7IWL1_9RHOB